MLFRSFNFLWTFANLVFHVTVGVGLALLLNQPGLKGVKLYRALLILPWAVPTYVTSLVWRNMFDPEAGAINLLLKQVATTFETWHAHVAWIPALGSDLREVHEDIGPVLAGDESVTLLCIEELHCAGRHDLTPLPDVRPGHEAPWLSTKATAPVVA